MSNIYLFGGSFNPFHRGHLSLIDFVLNRDSHGELWLMPTSFPPHKEAYELIEDHHRLAMIEISLGELDPGIRSRCRVETYEMKDRKTSYTIETLRHLRVHHRWTEPPYLMIGDDWVPQFHNWKEAQALAEEARLLVFHRLWKEEKDLAFPHEYLNNTMVNVSSSEIRRAIGEGKKNHQLVVSQVADYMEQHGLYRVDKRD